MVSAATREAMDTTRYFVSLEFVFRLMSASLDRGFLPALVREMTFAPPMLCGLGAVHHAAGAAGMADGEHRVPLV